MIFCIHTGYGAGSIPGWDHFKHCAELWVVKRYVAVTLNNCITKNRRAWCRLHVISMPVRWRILHLRLLTSECFIRSQLEGHNTHLGYCASGSRHEMNRNPKEHWLQLNFRQGSLKHDDFHPPIWANKIVINTLYFLKCE